MDCFLASFECLLGLTFMKHVSMKQLALERLDHVLLVVEVSVGTFNLLSAKLILVLLLLGVNFTTSNLLFFELLDTVLLTLVS